MKKLQLYSSRPVAGQSFTGVRSVVVPNQSLTLREIISRFVRKESLPIQMEGVYHEGLGDLEKLAREDIVVQRERAEDIKAKIAKADLRMKKKAVDEAAAVQAAKAANEKKEDVKPPEIKPQGA